MGDGIMIPLPATLRPYLLGAAGIAIIAAAIWVWRIDSLRASHKADAANVRREYDLFREQVTAKATEALIAQKGSTLPRNRSGRMKLMPPIRSTKPSWLRRTLLLSAIFATTACCGKQSIEVRAGKPVEPPKVTAPKVATDPVRKPTWLQ